MSTPTLPEKIAALLAGGHTYKAIASKAGCDTSTIFRIRNGDVLNPSYSVGVAIDEMHSDLRPFPSSKTAAA